MKYFLSFLALVLSYTSYSQITITSQSSCTSSTLTATLVGAGTSTTGLNTSDDWWSTVIPIGFTYNFYGVANTQCIIGTNGEIGFDLTNAGNYNTYQINGNLATSAGGGGGTSSDIEDLIAGPWCDMLISAGGTTYYSTVGTAPNRKFEVTFCGVGMYQCTTQYTTSQIIIYETSGIAEVHLGWKDICGWNGGAAIVGVVNSTGSASTTAPGRDWNPSWTVTTPEAWRFTPNAAGTAYAVTSIPYAPIPNAGSTIYWYDSTTGAYIGSGSQIIVSPPVTTTYEAVAVGCQDSSKTYYTVGPSGNNAPISGITTLCLGGTSTLSVGSSGGTWSSANPAVATINATTGVITTLSAGTAVINYTGTLICTGTTTVTVVHPSALTASSICLGGTETLTNPGAPGGTWTSSDGTVAPINSTTGVVNGLSNGTATITYSVYPGCTVTAPVSVVSLSPITGDTVLCQGTTTQLANTAPGGTWVSGNTGVATIGLSSGLVSGVSGGTSPITYSIAGGCHVYSSVTVIPRDPIMGSTSLCQRRATITLSDALEGGTWSSSNNTVATIESIAGVVHGVTPGQGGITTITYTNPFGCTSTIVVTVNPTPDTPLVVVTPPICQFYTPDTLQVNGPHGVLTWYGPGVTAGYSASPTAPTLLPGIDSYYVTQTSPFGCTSDSAIALVYVIPKPPTPIVDSISYCQHFGQGQGAYLNLLVDSSAGSVLNWYRNGVLLGHVPPRPQTDSADYPNGINYFVGQTINGCKSDSAAVNVVIVSQPNFVISSQQWVCQFDSISLLATNIGNPLTFGNFLWTLPAGATFVGGTSDTDQEVLVRFDSLFNDKITLVVDNLHRQCSSTFDTTIQVIALPTATATSKTDVCKGDTVILALASHSESAIDYSWYIDNTTPLFSSTALTIIAANSNAGGPYSIEWNDTGRHFISVQAYAEHRCTDKPNADSVNVHALPDASFRVTTLSGQLCLEDSVLFASNDSSYANLYNWAPEHYFATTYLHSVWGKVEQAQSIVTLTVTDPFGCHASSSQELDPAPCCTVQFPNAFTPNGDNLNDIFRPVPSNAYHTYHIFEITNRWGQVIFESTNNKASWDGTFNGVPQDVGVYFYYLKYDCNGKTLEEKGDVTLIR